MNNIEKPVRIIGVEASPYSVKLRAYCRYRHIPYRWVCRMPQYFEETQGLKPLIMPVVQYADGEYAVDSTPIMQALESQCDAARTISPPDPALRFLSLLVEDFADEWLTKCLFHYRFTYPEDRDYGPTWVMEDTHPNLSRAELERISEEFRQRQTERMPLVGCVPEHAPLFESTYKRVLDILERFVSLDKFLFGSRPSHGDFGLFGQLKTLSTDPTPRAVMRERAPHVDMWLMRLDDLSGLEGVFVDVENLAAATYELLELVAEIYLPYLIANDQAIDDGQERFTVSLRGHQYSQSTFKYHKKCLKTLRAEFVGLSADAKARVEQILGKENCESFTA